MASVLVIAWSFGKTVGVWQQSSGSDGASGSSSSNSGPAD
jgi:hypothetical protein